MPCNLKASRPFGREAFLCCQQPRARKKQGGDDMGGTWFNSCNHHIRADNIAASLSPATMRATLTLMVMLGAFQAHAQCGFVFVGHGSPHHYDSCAVHKPFVPSRVGGSMGWLGARDRA